MGKPKKTLSKTLNTINNASFVAKSLPKEVEPHIIQAFPIKSLLQFRTVSKTWQSIIDNPTFAQSHYSCAETRSRGARILISFSNSDGSRHYLYSVGLFGGHATHHLTFTGDDSPQGGCFFLAPVKGLVCFLDSKFVHVCNPSTKKVRTLPLCPKKTYSLNQSYFYKPYSCYSFGFESSSRVFKILHVFGTISRDDNKLYNIQSRVLTIKTPDVFHSNALSWKKIESSFPYPYPFKSQGLFVNGAIYWVGTRALGEDNIVTFDLKDEKFRLVPSPPNGLSSKSKLVNIGGDLGIMSFKDYGDFCLELWVYKNSSWAKKDVGSHFALKKKGMNSIFPTVLGNYYTGDKLLSPDVLLHNYVLRSLNGGERERGIKILGLPGWVDFLDYKKASLCMYNYVESLMSLDFVVRLGDFVMDLSEVKHPKQPPRMKLLPHVDVKVGKEWKCGGLIFGDLEEYQRREELLRKEKVKKIADEKARDEKWAKKVKNTTREDKFQRK